MYNVVLAITVLFCVVAILWQNHDIWYPHYKAWRHKVKILSVERNDLGFLVGVKWKCEDLDHNTLILTLQLDRHGYIDHHKVNIPGYVKFCARAAVEDYKDNLKRTHQQKYRQTLRTCYDPETKTLTNTDRLRR